MHVQRASAVYPHKVNCWINCANGNPNALNMTIHSTSPGDSIGSGNASIFISWMKASSIRSAIIQKRIYRRHGGSSLSFPISTTETRIEEPGNAEYNEMGE